MTNLRQNELVHLARLCVQEQGGSEAGVKGEASLILNRDRRNGMDAYEYVLTSGWFSKARYWMQYGSATQEQVDWVEDVLVNGNATLPPYIDEHDCFSDIEWISTGDVRDRSAYIKDVTVIKNRYGATYTFFCFLHSHSDPFGYTSKPKEKVLPDPDSQAVYLQIGE